MRTLEQTLTDKGTCLEVYFVLASFSGGGGGGGGGEIVANLETQKRLQSHTWLDRGKYRTDQSEGRFSAASPEV